MSATPELENEWKILLRSFLISDPIVKKASTLQREFEREEGPFPYRTLGYSSFVDYLRSIPSVVQLIPQNSPNPDVHPVVTKESSHIDKLVSKQRAAPKRPRSLPSRRGGYYGRAPRQGGPSIPLRRRPPSYSQPPLARPPLLPTPPLNKGVHVRDLENQFLNGYRREDLMRSGINSGHDLLAHARDLVVQQEDRIYPKMNSQADFTSDSNPSSVHYIGLPAPAGNEDDYDDNYVDLNDDDFWDSIPEEKLSNYTIERYSQAVSESEKYDEKLKRKEECEIACVEEEGEYCSENSEFSEAMIRNFRKILAKYPDGVWSTELPQKYFDEFKVKLDLQELGFNSAIQMANTLPSVFTYKRAGAHDWKLYDARLVKQVEPLSLKDRPVNVSVSCEDNERYVPLTILDNIKQLLKIYPDGFRSTALLSLYEKHFNKSLNLELLGFNRLEDFIEVLKKIITVLKSTDYSVLLPKHVPVPLEASVQPKPEETLKLSEESFQSMGPDNVMKVNDEIPYQTLPPLKENGKPNEPLIEVDVRVTEVMSPSLFYICFESTFDPLMELMDHLHKFYQLEEQNYHIPLPCLAENLLCACKYQEFWHRAKVTGLLRNNTIKIEYIDYGTPKTVERSELRYLLKDFATKLPLQGICANLHGIEPRNNEKKWSAEAKNDFLEIIKEKKLLAQVYHVDYHQGKKQIQLGIILFDLNGKETLEINEYLVKKGYAAYEQARNVPEDKLLSAMQDCTSASGNSGSDQPPKRTRTPPGFKKEDFSPKPNYEHLPPGYSVPLNNYLSSYSSQPPFSQPAFPQPTFSQPPFSQPTVSQPPLSNNYSSFFPSQNNDLIAFSLQQRNFFQNQQLISLTNNSIYNNLQFAPGASFSFQRPPPPFQINYHNQSHINYIPPQGNFYQQQTYGNAENFEFNISNKKFPDTNNKTVDKIPGWSSDLTLPRSIPKKQCPTFPHPNPDQSISGWHSSMMHHPQKPEIPAASQSKVMPVSEDSVSSVAASYTYEPDTDIFFSRPSTPLTPSSAEVSKLCIQSLHNTGKPSVPNHSGRDSINDVENRESKKISSYEQVLETTTDQFVQSHISDNPNVKRVSSTSDEYLISTKHVGDTVELTKYADIQDPSNTFMQCESKISETIPDSWEDIDADDTPAKSESYYEDFKNPLDFLNKSESDIKLNVPKMNIVNNLPLLNKMDILDNWKDMINTDMTNKSKGSNEVITTQTSPNREGTINLKKMLVQRMEIENKSFHLICVNKKPAVICPEFYPRFTPYSLHVISKIVEAKGKPFLVICKKDDQALFSELEKIEFSGNEKRNIIKLAKTTVSYLSEVSTVFSILNLQNKSLLDELQKILRQFDQS